MMTKTFGGFTVPAIGQGAGGNDLCDDKHRIRVLQDGIQLGMTLIDTAEAYLNGHSEELVGKAIQGQRGTVFISTKFTPEHSHYDDVMTALEGSLRRLNTEYVDLYQVHWRNPSVPIEETMRALGDLKASGKVRHIGVSNFSLQEFLEAQQVCGVKVESNQVEYNLLERGIEEEFLPYSQANRIMTIAYNPLLRGSKATETLTAMAKKYDKTPAQVILNWLISHETVVPIPKTLSLEHMKENALAVEFRLEQEDLADIERVFKRVVAEVPTNQIRVMPSDREPVYANLQEALENRFNLVPSPQELARDILDNHFLKPVHLKPSTDPTGRYDYDLIQGRIRYWAWVIAYGTDMPIPAYINE